MPWMLLRLDNLAAAVVLTVALLSVVMKGQMSAAFAGLAVSCKSSCSIFSLHGAYENLPPPSHQSTDALQLMGRLQMTVRTSIETENQMVSVERFDSLMQCPVEPRTLPVDDCASIGTDGIQVIITDGEEDPFRLPEGGSPVSFSGTTLRYREELPLVLRGVDLEIAAGEKVGICGRTGSGKSTIATTVLFRLVECGGSVKIGGRDIKAFPLEKLRAQLSCIPQDPVLFTGTMRDVSATGASESARKRVATDVCAQTFRARAAARRRGMGPLSQIFRARGGAWQ